MTKYEHFERPTQVQFYDHDGDHWLAGIAYKDEIICGCCGGIFTIEEVYEFAPSDVDEPIIPYKSWVDLEETITGDY